MLGLPLTRISQEACKGKWEILNESRMSGVDSRTKYHSISLGLLFRTSYGIFCGITYREVWMDGKTKSQENRIRRKAYRHGFILVKSRRRDPEALSYGLYGLLDPSVGGYVNPANVINEPYTWSLEEVESWLDTD